MNDAERLTRVYVLAVTSRSDLIDSALLRPRRLNKSLICDLSSLEDRLDILRGLSKKLKKLRISSRVLDTDNESDENLLKIAHRTAGYSGADLQAVVYNDHLEAIHDVLGGQDTSAKTNDEQKKNASRKSVLSPPGKDLIQFRFGEVMPLQNGISPSKQLVDNATSIAKLDDVKAARRYERQLRHGEDLFQPPSRNGHSDDRNSNDNVNQKVMIE